MESFILTLGLLVITSTIISYLGKAAASLLKLRFSSLLYLPFGLALVLVLGFLAFKLNSPWAIAPSIAVILFIPVFIAARSNFLRSEIRRTFFGRRFVEELRELIFPAISALSVSLVFLFQTVTTRGQVPLLTSFDTTSGDMFSYLILSEGLRNAGWEGQLNHVEVGVFDTGLGNLSQTFEHAGAGGYVLLALFATISGLKTWMVGTLVILVSLQSIVMAASGVLRTFTKLGNWQSLLFGNLAFGSLAYLTVVGWWALNQILFTLLFILLTWLLSVMLTNREFRVGPKYFLITGTMMALGFEVYPSVAMYSMLPIFLAIIGVFLYQATQTNPRNLLSALSSFIPLTYGFLGTFQFLPQIFAAQFDHKLDMGYRSSGMFDFLGLPISALTSWFFPDLKWFFESLNSPVIWGIALITFVGLHALRSWSKIAHLLPFLLTILGGSALISYTGLISQTSYQSHKLALMWYPLVILGTVVVMSQTTRRRRRANPGLRKMAYVALPVVILSNALAASYYFSLRLNNPEARQFHTISNEAVQLNERIQDLETVAIMTDFSEGGGWGALDRTVLPAIVTYPGRTIESGGSLAGYPFYSGWAVSSTPKNILAPSEGYVNEYYTLKYLCRLVCAQRDLGISVFIAGLPTSPSEMDKYKNMTFSADQLGGPLSLRIQGKPGQQLSIDSQWVGLPNANCQASLPFSVALDATGRARVPLGLGEKCQARLSSVGITDAK